MTRRNWKRTADRKYLINGKKYDMLVGSRRQVWNSTAYKTNPGKKALTKKNLMQKKNGNIVSRRKSATAKKQKNLGRYIDLARKNKGKKFQKMTKGLMKTNKTKRRKKRRKGTRKRR
tara:strand:- start:398 stop:748 length:351 start_codon:yes stop_codon:yes gene_type:complete